MFRSFDDRQPPRQLPAPAPGQLASVRLPDPASALVPARRFVTIGAGLAAVERANHNVRCALARAVSEHLKRAAVMLREPRSVDVLLLGAARTVEVIDAIDDGASKLGAPLPPDLAAELAASAERLRRWAMTLKRQQQWSGWPDDGDQTLPPWGRP